MTPLARYRERRLEERTLLVLYPEKLVRQTRRFLVHDASEVLRLSTLDPDLAIYRARHQWFRGALTSLVMGVILIATAWYIREIGEWSWMLLLGASVTIPSLVVMAATFRTIESVFFRSRRGGPGLWIHRRGPDKDQFDDFINAVRRQIIKAIHQAVR